MNGSSATYQELVLNYAPRPLRSEEEYWTARQRIDALLDKNQLSPDEQDYLEMLAAVVEKYEATLENKDEYELRGLALIRALLDEYGLRQKDLVDIFKTESIVSAVLNGRRDLTVENIDKLARRFNLPHMLFFETDRGREA